MILSLIFSNILIIMMDDISNEYIGFVGEGPIEHQPPTPNIDAFASSGIFFENFYTNPVCSPTRATVVTGRYSFRTGVGKAFKEPSGHLSLDELTFFEIADPFSCWLGKWHLGQAFSGFDVILHGVDLYSGRTPSWDFQDYFNWEETTSVPWQTATSPESGYLPTSEVDDSIQAILVLPEPWLIVVGISSVHVPFHRPGS